MPYHMLRRLGAQKAAVFLEGAKDTTVWPEVNEQLLSTNLTRNCDSLIEAATKLYYDESTKKVSPMQAQKMAGEVTTAMALHGDSGLYSRNFMRHTI